jgi:hypothetical protein
MPYTNPNATTWPELVMNASAMTGDTLGIWLLVIIWVVTFGALRIYYGNMQSATVASWIVFLSGLIMLNLGWIGNVIFLITVAMSIGSFILLSYDAERR